jgi:hypothetical protein
VKSGRPNAWASPSLARQLEKILSRRRARDGEHSTEKEIGPATNSHELRKLPESELTGVRNSRKRGNQTQIEAGNGDREPAHDD